MLLGPQTPLGVEGLRPKGKERSLLLRYFRPAKTLSNPMIEFDTHDPMRNCALTFCRYKTTVGLHKLPDTSSPLCLAQFWGHRRTRCGVAAEDSTCSHIFRILWKINKFPLTPIAQIEERTIGHTFCLDPRQLAAVLACFVTNN